MKLIDRDELMSVISEIESVVEFDGPIERVKVRGEEYEKVRHGKWKHSEYAGIDYYQCSLCLHAVRHTAENYCPNCGAKMDGGEHETD